MLKPWRFAGPVAFLLVALTACSATPEGKAAESPTTSKAQAGESTRATSGSSSAAVKRREIEAAKADCMKKKGFTYIAYIPKDKSSDTAVMAANGDYAAMKEFRSKYGFKIFSQIVYPDVQLHSSTARNDDDPNAAILAALSDSQNTTYRSSLEDCRVQAVGTVLGKVAGSAKDLQEARMRRGEQLSEQVDVNPRLVELAQPYADCLKGKGYRVDSAAPGRVTMAASWPFWQELNALRGESKTGEESDEISQEAARQHLAREIKAALDDLECGKDFYAVYLPEARHEESILNEEFGEP
ncbi:hypothetical protein [Rhizohabitans arisaemae]|uniref:hypothetical protein n=1 Tax=Rhizohabitans arisaemae TaxID=2720610 RepID=UPI0024B0B7DC|nr:hypothetical protein [Rhizohabitans arisaemae]